MNIFRVFFAPINFIEAVIILRIIYTVVDVIDKILLKMSCQGK